MIKNIVFDVGKVLVEWDCYKAFQTLGFDEKTAHAVAEATILTQEWNEYDRSLLSDKDQLAVFVSHNPSYEKEIATFFNQIGLPVKQYDYAIPWIQSLKKAGFHTYILSNYARKTYQMTREELSFESYMDGGIFSFQVGKIKPEPEIYQLLLDKYQLFPEETVFIDDLQENLDAAQKFKIHTILFENQQQAIKDLNRIIKENL